jgi:hypothetical protein
MNLNLEDSRGLYEGTILKMKIHETEKSDVNF